MKYIDLFAGVGGFHYGIDRAIETQEKRVGQESESCLRSETNQLQNDGECCNNQRSNGGSREVAMRILHVTPNIGTLNGAELYISDLALEQKKNGHDVSIYATNQIEGKVLNELKSHDVEIIDDLDDRFDIIHSHQAKSSMIASLLDIPVVQTVHSELFPTIEYPLVAKNIVHYICVRPTVQDFVCETVPKEKTSVVFNGVDTDRFFPVEYVKSKKPTVLFVGPDDYLRHQAIEILVSRAKKGEILLILVGRNQNTNCKNVISLPEMRGVELLTQRVDLTASIMMGRTTIEGWMCGKPGIVFIVDDLGAVKSQDLLPVPKDLSEFTLQSMYKKILEIYQCQIKNS